jgi:hypothetical protein
MSGGSDGFGSNGLNGAHQPMQPYGGLQPMQMYQAFRQGLPMVAPRMPMQPQYLPQPLAQQNYEPMAKQPTQAGLLQGAQGVGMGSASDGISPPGAPDIGEPEGVISGDGLGGASGGPGGK